MSEIKLKQDLEKEIQKWLPKLEKELKKIKSTEDKNFLTNIEAYLKDTYYFLEKKDLIRAFEAVIWGWAWLEIGQRENILK